jgi:hypothetical protein
VRIEEFERRYETTRGLEREDQAGIRQGTTHHARGCLRDV